MEKSLAVISSRVNNRASAIDQAQEYSYSYNVMLVGVPEIKPRENASETSQLCLNIFNAIGAEIHPYDIDLAHRVTLRQAAEGRPKPIACKFTRRVSREQVMALHSMAEGKRALSTDRNQVCKRLRQFWCPPRINKLRDYI